MQLYQASAQWANRPDDERFWNLPEALSSARSIRASSVEFNVNTRLLRVEADGEDLRLTSSELDHAGVPRPVVSHHAFAQLCQRGDPKSPASYLRKLRPTLAAQVLNSCLKAQADTVLSEEDEKQMTASLLLHGVNGGTVLRAATSERYERIWNEAIIEKLTGLPSEWRVPPARKVSGVRSRPATAEDLCVSSSIQVGEEISPSGIYVSDHDLFIYLINDSMRVADGLSKGFFIWNSEVGAKSFGLTTFLYNHTCGNHIVWGAKDVREFRVRHIGDVAHAYERGMMELEMTSFADDGAIITNAKRMVLGVGKDMVVEEIMKIILQKRIPLPQKLLESAYDTAARREDWYGPPVTLWAMVSGITENSQRVAYADERNNIDRAAGRLLDIARA